MYKLVLCWRYLLTRYLALVCIVSVMLGVATLIVVNSVMAGFSTKLKDRMHGLLSDIDVVAAGGDKLALTIPGNAWKRFRDALWGTIPGYSIMVLVHRPLRRHAIEFQCGGAWNEDDDR